MPGVASDAGSRVLEGFELESLRGNSDATPVGEQPFSVRRNEVRERPPLPHMAMQPEAAIHRVDHTFATRPELAKCRVLDRSIGIGRGVSLLHLRCA